MGKQDGLGKRSGIGFAGKGGEMSARQRLPSRARVTPQREQSEATHGKAPREKVGDGILAKMVRAQWVLLQMAW